MGFVERLGRGAWLLIHSMLYNVSDAESLEHYKRTVIGIIRLYPCEKCRRHAAEDSVMQNHLGKLQGMVWEGGTQDALKLWAYEAHLRVSAHPQVRCKHADRWAELNPRHAVDPSDKAARTAALLRELDERWMVSHEESPSLTI
jgi:hypothetical protein